MEIERLSRASLSQRAHGDELSRFLQLQRVGFWLYAVVMVAAVVLTAWAVIVTFTGPNAPFALGALVIWAIWAAAMAAILCRADLFAAVPTGVRVAAFTWGVFAVWRFGGLANGLIATLVPAGLGHWSSVLVAPPVEEGFKLLGMILIALVVPRVMGRMMGGLVCGMLTGLGFAFMENWGYANGILETANGAGEKLGVLGMWLVTRGVLFGPWEHSTYAAISALGVTYFLAHRDRVLPIRIAVAAGAFILAMLMHAASNATVVLGQMVIQIAVEVATLALLVALILWARSRERQWFTSTTAGHVGGPVLTEAEAVSLRTREGRRREARAATTRASRRAIRDRRSAQIAYANALAYNEDPARSPHVDELSGRIQELRAAG